MKHKHNYSFYKLVYRWSGEIGTPTALMLCSEDNCNKRIKEIDITDEEEE